MSGRLPLSIESCGAVTPIGLTSAQSYAAIRAGVTNFRSVYWRLPIDEPGLGAQIPAAASLRSEPTQWLANMAARAIRECLSGHTVNASDTALLWCLPESPRLEQCFSGIRDAGLRATIEARLHCGFSPHSLDFDGGPAGLVEALDQARRLLRSGDVRWVIVGGADSLIGHAEIERLQARKRIHGGGQPHGLLPAEGACCLLLSSASEEQRPLARILGLGLAHERHTVLGPKLSIGEALLAALEGARADASTSEASVTFVCSNANGERYGRWETNHTRMRFYRTRREHLPVLLPSHRAGDLGSASGALALVVATIALANGDAPGALGMCELASEGSLRAACVLEAAQRGPMLSPGRRALASLMVRGD